MRTADMALISKVEGMSQFLDVGSATILMNGSGVGIWCLCTARPQWEHV